MTDNAQLPSASPDTPKSTLSSTMASETAEWARTHIFHGRPVQLISPCSIYSPEGNMWTNAFIYETEDGFRIAVPARVWYRESYKLGNSE